MNHTTRPWGYYNILHDVDGCKVKELVVEPGQSLSMQKHALRSEFWLVSKGRCVVNSKLESGYQLPSKMLTKHDYLLIDKDQWHQLTNPFQESCHIVEIQYGQKCVEEDIERQEKIG